MARSILLLGCSAMLLTSAAAPPLPDPVQRHRDSGSPVKCRQFAQEDARRPQPVGMPAPRIAPPAPPPMPTPSPVPTLHAPSGVVASPSIAVTGQRVGGPAAPAKYGAPGNTERYDGKEFASIQSVADAPVSTFSIDVDTGSYSNVRRFLNGGDLPPPEAVRTEEMINYFRYDYPVPRSTAEPFSVTTDVTTTPWNPDTRLMRVGLRGYDTMAKGRPPANLVFLIDVSGSMSSYDKLPLVKHALTRLADQLGPRDRVSIVVYAGASGVVLEPTYKKEYVKAALSCLEAGGSTAGADGIELAYSLARKNYVKGGINRIFLATDGDFNVGVSDNKALEELVKRQRDSGITLTTLGFGEGNYNEAMMERIADVGNGNYAYIDSAMEAEKVLDDELSATLYTIAKDVKVQVEFNPAYVSQYRLIGYENRALAEEDFTNDTVDAGDMGAGHQVTAIYEIVPAGTRGWLPDRRYQANRPRPGGAPSGEMAFVKLRYKLPGEQRSREMARPVPAIAIPNASAPRGDAAFAVAVAAFGQKLRGDKYLNGYGWAQIRSLAGSPRGYWRNEFVKLVGMAEKHTPAAPQ